MGNLAISYTVSLLSQRSLAALFQKDSSWSSPLCHCPTNNWSGGSLQSSTRVERLGHQSCTAALSTTSCNNINQLLYEKQRILCAGGRVFSVEYADGVDGPPRVWLGNMDMPGLAMSRSLGDAIAHTAGVISDPDTYLCDLVDSGCRTRYEGETYEGASGGEAVVIILATDGLWEFITDQEAVDIASQCSEPRQAVERLIHEAGERWMKEEQVIDDTTVCVAFIKNWVGGTGGGQG